MELVPWSFLCSQADRSQNYAPMTLENETRLVALQTPTGPQAWVGCVFLVLKYNLNDLHKMILQTTEV